MEFCGLLLILGVAGLGAGIYIVKVGHEHSYDNSPDECPPNEEYLLCGTPCPANCTTPESELCSTECEEGCFCTVGYLRNENGTCVTPEECGNTLECGENEEFLSCGPACPATCSQPDPVVCDFICKTGCTCKAGFVKDESSGKCVAVEKCPVDPCLNENEIYDLCNAGCEPSCSDPEPICTKICIGGCVCASGLFRNETGECVSVDKCPVGNNTDIGLLSKYLNAINRILHV